MAIPYGDAGSPRRGGLPRPAINRARQHINRTFGARPRAMGGMGQGGSNSQGSPPGETAVNPYDYSSDPLLQRIRAAGQQRIGEGEAEALRQRKQLLIDYGDADLARSLGMDEATIQAAGNNAFSTRAALAREQHDRPIALDNTLQRGNLFYSGDRGIQQSNLATSLLGHQHQAEQAAQSGLSGINETLRGLYSNVNDANMQAEEDAANRLTQQLGELPVGGQPGAVGGGGHRPFAGVRPRGFPGGNEPLLQMLRPRGPVMPKPRNFPRPPHFPGRRP